MSESQPRVVFDFGDRQIVVNADCQICGETLSQDSFYVVSGELVCDACLEKGIKDDSIQEDEEGNFDYSN